MATESKPIKLTFVWATDREFSRAAGIIAIFNWWVVWTQAYRFDLDTENDIIVKDSSILRAAENDETMLNHKLNKYIFGSSLTWKGSFNAHKHVQLRF